MRRNTGFTLVEILIAMAITAVIGTLIFTTLTTTIRNYHIIEEHRSRLLKMQTFLRVWQQDIASVVNQHTFNSSKENFPAFSVAIYPQLTLTLSRSFSLNQASGIKWIKYYLERGSLIREYWSDQNGKPGNLDKRDRLITGISSWHIDVYDQDNKILSTWPFYGEAAELPNALDVYLCLNPNICFSRFIMLNGSKANNYELV